VQHAAGGTYILKAITNALQNGLLTPCVYTCVRLQSMCNCVIMFKGVFVYASKYSRLYLLIFWPINMDGHAQLGCQATWTAWTAAQCSKQMPNATCIQQAGGCTLVAGKAQWRAQTPCLTSILNIIAKHDAVSKCLSGNHALAISGAGKLHMAAASPYQSCACMKMLILLMS